MNDEDVKTLLSIATNFYRNQERPSVIYKPEVYLARDGRWCARYGEHGGVCGRGLSPALACADFDRNWSVEVDPPVLMRDSDPEEEGEVLTAGWARRWLEKYRGTNSVWDQYRSITAIVFLRDTEGMSFDEIAQEWGVPNFRVESLYRRGVKTGGATRAGHDLRFLPEEAYIKLLRHGRKFPDLGIEEVTDEPSLRKLLQALVKIGSGKINCTRAVRSEIDEWLTETRGRYGI